MEIDAEMQWVTLQIDHSVGEIKDPQKSGLISIRLAINDRTDNGDIDWDYVPNWSEDRPEAPSFYNVRAHIFQCKNLPAADTDGSCDPYIMVYSPDEEKKFTQIIHDNNNPIFYESVEFTYPLMGDTLESAPPFILDIIDADSGLFDSDDQVGRAIIQFQEAAYIMDEHVPKPRWHPIKREFKDDEPVMGEILVSFSIIDPGKEFSRTLDQIRLQPETMEYNISINVLGLRNLESVGILPVKKPFIKFYLKSLLPPSKSGVVDNIQTQPHSPGPNPTLSTVIKFKISLPTDPLYCPTLTCGVYDYIFKGISQPMIGNFTIPLGKKLIRDKEQRKVESNETDRIISTISRMIDESEQIREEIEEDQVLESESKNLNEEIDKMIKKDLGQNLQILDENAASQAEFVGLDEIEIAEIHPEEDDDPDEHMEGNPIFDIDEKIKERDLLLIKNNQQAVNDTLKNRLLKKVNYMAKVAMIDQKLAKNMKNFGKVVILPKYEYDDRLKIEVEIEKPTDQRYWELGFDENPGDMRKHYRMYYEDELENIEEIMPSSPFDTEDISRGQLRGLKKKKGYETSTFKTVGKFKGIINVVNAEDEQAFAEVRKVKIDALKNIVADLHERVLGEPFDFNYAELTTHEGREKFRAKMVQLNCEKLQISKHLVKLDYNDQLTRMMLKVTKCVVRVYILNAYDLMSKDNGSASDPYLKLKMNKTEFDERKNYQENETNPQIFKCFEFEAEFPGTESLRIQLWDHDLCFGDDLIGETKIDLEDRYFSHEWQSLKNKPIEFRQLYHPSSKVS